MGVAPWTLLACAMTTQSRIAANAVVVREATRSDLEGVTRIEDLSFPDPWSSGAFASALGNPRIFFAVAVSTADAGVAGYVVAWFVADEGELANVAVAPAALGTGVGGLLVDAAVEAGLGRGALALYLEVRVSNAEAQKLYESRGFVRVGRRRNYYRNPAEDALVLRLELATAVRPK